MMKRKIKVLIIHGWSHSGRRYHKLARELTQCNVDIVTLPGFGDTLPLKTKNIIQTYINALQKTINETHYDLIVAHSMGCNLLLNTEIQYKTNILLFNPASNGVHRYRPLLKTLPILERNLIILRRLPYILQKPVAKYSNILAINKLNLVDQIIIDDILQSDPRTIITTLRWLIEQDVTINPSINQHQIKIYFSEKDRVIHPTAIQYLQKQLGLECSYSLGTVGHTTILESYASFIKVIQDEVNQLIRVR